MTGPLRCVLFDLDGVLADYDRDVRIAVLAGELDRDAAAVRAAIYGSGIEDAADAGRLDSAAYLTALGRELGRPVDADAWVRARRAATAVRPAMLALANDLQTRGIAVAVLSNNSTLMAERWIDIVPALFPLFANRAFCSGSLGAPKPAPAVYRRCLDALAVAPRETLFVDDNAANVDGARAAGLRGHCFLSQAELAEALVRLGLG